MKQASPVNSMVTSPRHGAVLVIALICLLLMTVLAASLTRTALLQRQQVIRDEQQLQAEWLAEAGVDRAAVILSFNPDYAGEEWLPASDGDSPLGRIRIEVEASTMETSQRRVVVVAHVPASGHDRVQVEQTTLINVGQQIED